MKKKPTQIWLIAILSTLIIAAVITLIAAIPSIIGDFNNIREILHPGLFLASIMNWARYVVVWVIIYFLYNILNQNHKNAEEKLKAVNAAKSFELELLKAQINPHFLFNALNSIKALVTINPEKCGEAIVMLSELLRYTLNYGNHLLVPLNDELNEVKKYLALEQLRFGQRLIVEYDIAENTLNQTIPPALVLTLAENAIKHGVSQQIGATCVQVQTRLEAHQLCIKVLNTGNYVKKDTVGIGLKHVRRRLEEIYGNRAIFDIQNQTPNVIAAIYIHHNEP
ncbi:MAG: sensor histidine kinase [Saprospiraceae bacterium]